MKLPVFGRLSSKRDMEVCFGPGKRQDLLSSRIQLCKIVQSTMHAAVSTSYHHTSEASSTRCGSFNASDSLGKRVCALHCSTHFTQLCLVLNIPGLVILFLCKMDRQDRHFKIWAFHGVSINGGYPKLWLVFVRENPDIGIPYIIYFSER